MYWPRAAKVTASQLMSVLEKAQLSFILMGSNGISGWVCEPQGCQDVDVLVSVRNYAKACDLLKNRWPKLRIAKEHGRTRFVDRFNDLEVVDLRKPTLPILREVFRQTVKLNGYCYVANLEMSLACRFSLMVDARRDHCSKYLDAADFLNLCEFRRTEFRMDLLKNLGELVHPGGGARLVRFINDARAGRRLEIFN